MTNWDSVRLFPLSFPPLRFESRQLVAQRPQVPRPHVPRKTEEVPPLARVVVQECAESPLAFERVAAPTRRHYVAFRPVAAPDARLDVIHRELLGRKALTAVDASISVALEDSISLHKWSTCRIPDG